MRPRKHDALDRSDPPGVILDEIEYLNANIRAKSRVPVSVIERQFGFVKILYRGWKKNTAQLTHLSRSRIFGWCVASC
jgi:IS5 family transposase